MQSAIWKNYSEFILAQSRNKRGYDSTESLPIIKEVKIPMSDRKEHPFQDTQSQKWPRENDSLGNVETKIDFIINLNLQMLNLIVTLSSWIHEKETLPDNIVKELKLLQTTLPKLFTAEGSKLVFMENIQNMNMKIGQLLENYDYLVNEKEVLDTPPAEPARFLHKKQDFLREETDDDRWGIIESIESIMRSYSNLSHLAFPNLYFVSCKEVLNYKQTRSLTHPDSHEITQIPALRLKNLILKLLREAPSARLLQNLKKMYPLENSRLMENSEEEAIRNIVQKYYSNVSEYLEDKRTLLDSLRVSNAVLNQYDLGPGDLESRIPNVSFTIVKDIQKELQGAKGNDFQQFIFSETIVLIHRLNGYILQNERFKLLLRMLK